MIQQTAFEKLRMPIRNPGFNFSYLSGTGVALVNHAQMRVPQQRLLAVRLKLLARLKTDGLARRDGHFFSGARITPDAALARLNYENAKTTQLNPIASRQCFLHRMKQRIDGLFGLQFRNAGLVGETIDNIQFDHERGLRSGFVDWLAMV